MKQIRLLVCGLFAMVGALASAQTTLDLPTARKLALENNKELAIGALEKDVAYNTRKAAETNYLPKVSGTAGYMHLGKSISLLNNEQKKLLNTAGTSLTSGLTGTLQNYSQQIAAIIAQYPDLAPLVSQATTALGTVGTTLNSVGHDVVNAFSSDAHDYAGAAILLTQPLYMGGKIRAYDKITHYSEELADQKLRGSEQEVILEVDQAYWQLVSLTNKKVLATSYRDMLKKLDDDVNKMIREGVATKATELQVSVKLNEAEMMLTKVDNGLVLSRMLLAQLCGLPIDTELHAAEESNLDLSVPHDDVEADTQTALANRPELCQLETAVNIYKEKVNITRADFLPQLAAMGGYAISNPNLYNGFSKKFSGNWGIGLTLKVPIWNWGEGKYKVRAAKAEADMAAYRLDDIREKIELQVAQESFRVNEANKQYRLAVKNLEQADENLRIANLGYREGVITMTDVLQAQTAWLQAHSDKIDAEINILITRATLRKALGTLKCD